MSAAGVCPGCARRTWLLTRLAGHLEGGRARIAELLGLGDAELIAAVGGAERETIGRELAAVDPAALTAARERAGVTALCRCASAYPQPLRDLEHPPAVLHVLPGEGGRERLAEFLAGGAVAVVGSRVASPYGRSVARRLGGELAAAGLTVVSGLALGVDGAAHEGALAAGGRTIAVLGAGVEHPYPASHRRLHARIVDHGVVVSELGPVTGGPRRWMFPARNRIIAALAEMTVVVQAGRGSGALLTARGAEACGRPLGAVPGSVESPLSVGPHRLLREGASVVAGAGDVLEALYGVAPPVRPDPRRAALDPPHAALLDAIAAGEDGPAAFARAGLDGPDGLAALAALELAGLVRRGPGGRYGVG